MRVSLFVLLFLAGCAPYPMVNYYDLDAAISDAETEEEREYYEGRLAYYEKQAEKAGIYLDAYQACEANRDCQIVCVFAGATYPIGGPDPEKSNVDRGIPELVRWYEKVGNSCGFVGRDEWR